MDEQMPRTAAEWHAIENPQRMVCWRAFSVSERVRMVLRLRQSREATEAAQILALAVAEQEVVAALQDPTPE
jgi:hypothetical protein